jgi:hypothetical protein
MKTLTDMVSNDSPLPTWKIPEGNMHTETVRNIPTENLHKRKRCAKKRNKKICGKTRNFMRLFSKTAGNKASQGEEEKNSDLCQRGLSMMQQSNQL